MILKAYSLISRCFRIVESSVLVSCLFTIILLTVLQIILRNVFSFSLSWVEPLNQHLVLVVAFMGAMVAGRKGEHIAFDVVQHYLPSRLRKFFGVLGSLLSAGVCFYLAYLCAELTYMDYLDPMYAFGSVPQWVFEIFIPLGFFVVGYRLLKVSIVALFVNGEELDVPNAGDKEVDHNAVNPKSLNPEPFDRTALNLKVNTENTESTDNQNSELDANTAEPKS
ncbi:MAG: C4-dicarboxylate transporter DctQ subunit [Flavobacteriales bacterium]|jgi:C4-dicarboxylate transporter DctQ subunit